MTKVSTALPSSSSHRVLVVPSSLETSFLSTLPGFEVEKNAQASPLGRDATPADLAPVLQLLLSGDAPYLSGAVVPVTSGSQF